MHQETVAALRKPLAAAPSSGRPGESLQILAWDYSGCVVIMLL